MFFMLPNTVSAAVSPIEKPWEFQGDWVPDRITSKDQYMSWVQDPTTNSCFISAFEGMCPGLRINTKDNVPFCMHALIVDYDSAFKEDTHIPIISRAKWTPYLPSRYCVTYSSHLRLIWEFESPIMLAGTEHAEAFIEHANKELRLIKWHGGFDAPALKNMTLHYHIGRKWGELFSGKKIPKQILNLWQYEASKKVDFSGGRDIKIPLDEVRQEIEEQYPGKWKGPFTVGRQCVRFWDDSADNQTGAWLKEDGFVCFTGGLPFVSWKELLGAAFVDRYEADRVAKWRDRTVYDGDKFYVLKDNSWICTNKDDFGQMLRCNKINPTRRRGETCSEVDLVENDIKLNRKVEEVAPLIHFPQGIVMLEGKRYLNIATNKVVQPSPPVTKGPMTFLDGRQYFPFLYEYLKTMFVNPEETQDYSCDPQLEYLLAWIAHFYRGALELTPKQGQALVIAGAVGKGKGFFSSGFLGPLMGGSADASAHLTGGATSQWTQTLAVPVWCVDDQMANGDFHAHKQFSARIKKYVASPAMEWNAKFKVVKQTPWFGRIVVTCNTDSESLRILPDMDMNTLDKIMLLKTSEHKVRFKEREENAAIVNAELPFFARFLLDWVFPNHVLGERRFGVRSYHHPELLEEAHQQGSCGSVLGLIYPWLADYEKSIAKSSTDTHWLGTSNQLYECLNAFSPSVMRDLKPRALATILGVLQQKGFNVKKIKSPAQGPAKWLIPFDLGLTPVKK